MKVLLVEDHRDLASAILIGDSAPTPFLVGSRSADSGVTTHAELTRVLFG